MPALCGQTSASGREWIHEIKHDGVRLIAAGTRRRAPGTRNGNESVNRFPRIVETIASLPVEFCLIDGEAIVVDVNGLAVFDPLCSWRVTTTAPYSVPSTLS